MKPNRFVYFFAGSVLAASAAAQPASELFQGADLALGERLLKEHRCTECHARNVGGDGAAIYRPAGRVNTPSALASMVERCNTNLTLGMFPEDVSAVAAVLNRKYYHFK